jgi:hypothetical protein
MATRLREVVVAQHRRLLTVIDRAEASLDDGTLRRLGKSVVAHLDSEKELLFPLAARIGDGARYGEEEHIVLRFALERLLTAKHSRDRSTRLRVLRDLFVHHMERTEWITLQLLERPSAGTASKKATTARAPRSSPARRRL